MLQGQVGGWVGGLRGVGILVTCHCSIPQNPDYPLQLLKIVIITTFEFFVWGKLWLDLKINHRVTVSQKNANLSRYEMPLI